MSKEVSIKQVIEAIKTSKVKKFKVMPNYIGEGTVLIQAREKLLKDMFGKNILDSPEKTDRADMTAKEKDKQ